MKKRLVSLIMIWVLLFPLAVPLTVYADGGREDVKIKPVKENGVWRQKLMFTIDYTVSSVPKVLDFSGFSF
ncbi:hypothetical protein FQB35_12540 [Crassaminicella thermophila]|uniref:Uncharacterized protein n=1 Tax=Crassaminicella thermophila TaxID=2599308 RepID=A0A5C0SJF1_CRATE|nr:hypothetical protein [Crassaminicella thermophila]QEK13079.1 hypothetical protein FQB35_12540 [Crassaminicella thermophila]